MNIKTKFELGDRVWVISRGTRLYWERCTFCEGSNSPVTLGKMSEVTGKDGTTRWCPECRGEGGKQKRLHKTWEPEVDKITLSRIEVRITEDIHKEVYMAGNSGSGRLFSAENLFLELDDAISECQRRGLEDV